MERITYQDIPEGMFQHLITIEEFIKKSGLEQNLLELLRLRISQINGCAYCVDMHYKELKHTNENELRLSSLAVWKETPYFTDKERAALNFAEELTALSNAPIQNNIYNTIETFFSKKEISFLSLAVTQINTWNRLMKTFLFTPGKYKVTS
ncbi:carboxymuconolactone decarboxylase family protein [uncultured Maribacter sp.]|uniref:carboxymuconolactone decarboxylase family protein n=1 Tax=uncultured Maribacter sp. TaxID=431308 RepID=UPI002631B465|nr:carboxymuconolactone decarboxylase family protein [uncultured Maribacter sp.]